jgi:tRNA U55 pseudouridine synthase TruB
VFHRAASPVCLPPTAVSTLATLQANQTITGVAAIDPATKIKGAFTDAAKSYTVIVHFYAAPAEAEMAVLANQMAVRDTAVGVMNFAEGEATT